jgi:hypothetical protein
VPESWNDTPIVFTTACGCPHCHAAEHKRTDTEDQGDGSIVRYCICKRCGKQYRNVVEPFHDSWESVDWLRYVPPNDEARPNDDNYRS